MGSMKPESSNPSELSQRALLRWDGEGGAGPAGLQAANLSEATDIPILELTNAEMTQLRVRVIALENTLIALLAGASDRQLDLAREMAGYIAPRPGFTQHALTIHAATHMTDLVERSNHFRAPPPRAMPYKCTEIFDENTLPQGLRLEHLTKAGVWGVIRVLDGRLRYQVRDPESEAILEPGHPGLIKPEEFHRVEPIGPMRMRVEFYDRLPDL